MRPKKGQPHLSTWYASPRKAAASRCPAVRVDVPNLDSTKYVCPLDSHTLLAAEGPHLRAASDCFGTVERFDCRQPLDAPAATRRFTVARMPGPPASGRS